jgi:glucokinase
MSGAKRVASGMGIENIYKFLRDTGRGKELASVAEEMKTSEAGAVISKYANSGQCPMCAKTIDIFVNCLGAEAANMALKTMSTGGVFIGGGIPAKLLQPHPERCVSSRLQ